MAVLYIILFITSFLFYILYQPVFSFYLFAFLLLIPIILFCIGKYMSRRIKVSFVTVQRSASRSSKIPLVLKVTNNTRFPVSSLIVEIEYFNTLEKKKNIMKINTPVFPDETQYLTLHISGVHYGTIKMVIKKCKVVDMLKLFKFKVKYPDSEKIFKESTFTIVPDYISIDNKIANYSEMGLETDEYSKTSKGDDPSEIFDIHEYQDGDKISRIHWKLSAKQNKTMVKDYSLPISNSILLVLDLSLTNDSDEFLEKYDTLIETAASISNYLILNETPHKVIWYDIVKNQLVKFNVTDEESHRMMVNILLQTTIYKDNDLSVISYINETERYKCGHLMYFSASYNPNLTTIMEDNDLAYKYSYMLVTGEELQLSDVYDDFAQVVSVRTGRVAESIQDICF